MIVSARKPRKDVVRNKRAILRAAGILLRDDPTAVTIPAVAERAGLSAPTVYRYFPSANALLDRYMVGVLSELRDYSHDADERGERLFGAVMREWGEILEVYGPGLVQLRSRRGFLTRLHEGDELMQISREAWERPLRHLMKSQGIDPARFESALFLLNMMFDPREILDLIARGHSMTQALDLMTIAFLSAVRGWETTDSALV